MMNTDDAYHRAFYLEVDKMRKLQRKMYPVQRFELKVDRMLDVILRPSLVDRMLKFILRPSLFEKDKENTEVENVATNRVD